MFSYKPSLSQFLTPVPGLKDSVVRDVGDIKQPWTDLANLLGIDEFSAKAYFVVGMIRRYILSANAILGVLDHKGFMTAYSLLCGGIELLGRCYHSDQLVRQHPNNKSTDRLKAGLEFIRRNHLSSGQVVATNHYKTEDGGYSVDDLVNLRNLVTHGGGIAKVVNIKGDIELLNELRTALWCVPIGDNDPTLGAGPIAGALDRYFNLLACEDITACDRLASAAVSPIPVQLQQNQSWRFDKTLVEETMKHIEGNLQSNRSPISGGFRKSDDHFQLLAQRN